MGKTKQYCEQIHISEGAYVDELLRLCSKALRMFRNMEEDGEGVDKKDYDAFIEELGRKIEIVSNNITRP